MELSGLSIVALLAQAPVYACTCFARKTSKARPRIISERMGYTSEFWSVESREDTFLISSDCLYALIRTDHGIDILGHHLKDDIQKMDHQRIDVQQRGKMQQDHEGPEELHAFPAFPRPLVARGVSCVDAEHPVIEEQGSQGGGWLGRLWSGRAMCDKKPR